MNTASIRRKYSPGIKFGMFEKYFLLFCLVIIIPIIIATAILYAFSVGIVEEEVSISNRQLLTNVSKITDDRINEIKSVLVYLANNSYIHEILVNNVVYTDLEFIMLAYEVKKELANMLVSREYLQDIYLYMDEDELIINSEGQHRFRDFFMSENKFDSMTLEDIRNMLIQRNNLEILETKRISGKRNILPAVVRVPLSGSKKGSIVINIDADKFFSSISADINTKGEILILNEKNQVITHVGHSKTALSYVDRLVDTLNTAEEDNVIVDLGGTATQVTWLDWEGKKWKYIALIPYDEFTRKSTSIKNISIITCAFFLLASFAISFLMSRRIYNPIRLIANKLRSTGNITSDSFPGNGAGWSQAKACCSPMHLPGVVPRKRLSEVIFSPVLKEYRWSVKENISSHKENEYKIIDNAIDTILQETDRLSNAYNKSKELVKERFFYRLLKGDINDSEEVAENIYKFDLPLNGNIIVPILIEVKYSRHIRTKMTEGEKRLFHSEIIKTLNEAAEVCTQGTLIELGNNQFCLIAILQKYDDGLAGETVKTIMKRIGKFEQYINITMVEGQAVSNYHELDLYYKQMKNTIGNRVFGEKMQILSVQRDEVNESERNYLVNGAGKQLVNSLLNADSKYAMSLLKNVIQKCLDKKLSQKSVRIILVEILNSAIQLIKDTGDSPRNIIDNYYTLYDELEECSTGEEAEDLFEDVFATIARYYNNKKNRDEDKNIREILDFINTNYQKQISLDLMSEKAGISSSYFSKYFKDKVGENFIDYLNRIRLNKAKELLLNRKFKINEISDMVGYLNNNTFNVVFKKYEGITPGTYRKKALGEAAGSEVEEAGTVGK